MLAPSSALSKVVVPRLLFIGLGVVVVGLAVGGAQIALFMASALGGVRLTSLLIAPICLVAGVAIVANCFREGCTRCYAELSGARCDLPLELAGHADHAVLLAGRGELRPLLGLTAAPLPYGPAAVASVEAAYCPECRAIAKLVSAQLVPSADGTSTRRETVTLEVHGAEIGEIVARMSARHPGA